MRHRPRSMSPWHRIAFRLGSAALGVIVLIGALELFMRVFPHHLPTAALFRLHDRAIAANELKSLPHEEIGYVWQPGIRAELEGWQFAFTYSTDEHGFRNRGRWPNRADIVVVGDSQAFGFGVNDGEEWVQRLAQALPSAEIVNLGLIGAAPQQFPEVFEAYGAPLRPQVVVVALFPPNAIGMGRLFQEWVAEGKPERFDVRRLRGPGPGSTPGLLGAIKDRLRESYAILTIHYGLKQLAGNADLITVKFDNGGEVRLVPTRYGDAAALAAPGRAEFERTIAILERLRDQAHEHGAELLVVPFPTKEEVLLPMLGKRPNRLVAPLVAELERRGIPALDLTPYLRERAARGEQLFFEIDLHPNEAGQQLIAEVLSEHLKVHLAASGAARGPVSLDATVSGPRS